ncbi:MAG TPA: toxin-antitoxin system HicB family antitoxin [Streptosporangiaceae bacterium]|nr:toxin-antitoxin system HicB family antitoxin [Streptosporangiaceae bacterium]
MADTKKSFLLHLDSSAHERLAVAAARAGVSMQVYVQDAIDSAAQEDEALGLAAQALAGYGEAFGLDPAGNARKVAELRSRTRAVA